MFRFLRIATTILSRRVYSLTSAAPHFSTTVSANGISPQNDHMSSLGSAAGMFSGRPLALRCWLEVGTTKLNTQLQRTSGRRSNELKDCLGDLSYDVPNGGAYKPLSNSIPIKVVRL
jgi:hypothetical protein